MQSLGEQLKLIKPYVLRWIGESGSATGSSAPSPHDMVSKHHTGSISDAQGPQFLKSDGSRSLSGNLSVGVGITIDGVDLSVHAADPAAHHTPFTALTDDAASPASPSGIFRIQIAGGNGIGSTTGTNKITLDMDTPSTLSVSSTNAASSGHSHAITSSPTPGAAASLLATDALGQLTLAGKLTLGNTTEALRISFDVSNYTSLVTTSGGNFVVAPTGDVQFNPAGKDILPQANYDLNLGALQKKYLTLHAAELWVETLVAQDTLATIGGRVLVGPTTQFTTDFLAGPIPGVLATALSTSTAVTGIVLTVPASSVGDLLFVSINWKSATVTVTPPAGWTTALTPAANATMNSILYYRIVDGTETATYTWTLSVACPQSSVMVRVSGNYTASPTGTAQTASITSATAFTVPSLTITKEGALVMYFMAASTVPTITPPGSLFEYFEQAAGGTQMTAEFAALGAFAAGSTGTISGTASVAASGIAYAFALYPNPLSQGTTKHNNLAIGDTVFMEASGKIEFMSVASGPAGTGPYTYTFNRNLDNTGLNDWYAGDAIFNTGQAGNGFIDEYSTWGAGITPFEWLFNLDETSGVTPFETGTYSSNHANEITWTYFELASAVNDAVYFGSSSAFAAIHMWLTTAGVGSFGFGFEYWNGATGLWTAVVSPTTFPGSFLLTIGDVGATWSNTTGTPGWAPHTINGVSAYWIRLRIQSGSLSTKPVQGVRRVNKTKAQYGPSIVMNTRNSSTFNDWTERTAMGNLNGLYGYGNDIFGFAAGKNAGNWFSVEETNGFRIFNGAILKAQWDTSGNITIGRAAAGESNLFLSAGGMQGRTNTTIHFDLQTDGDVFIGENTAAAASTNIAIFTTAQTYNSEVVAAGDFIIGDNSTSKANVKWTKSTGKLSFRSGTTVHSYINTTGAFTSGDDRITIDNTGLTIIANGTNNEIRFKDSTTLTGELYSYLQGGTAANITLRCNQSRTVNPAAMIIETFGSNGGSSTFVSLVEDLSGATPFMGIDFRKAGTLTGGLYLGSTTTVPATLLQLSTDSASKPTTSAWTIASDERTKENIQPYEGALELMLALPGPITYRHNGKGGTPLGAEGVGYSAQMIREVAPRMISTFSVKLNPEDEEDTEILAFNPHEITMATPAAIKSLHAMIVDLKRQLEQLK